MPALGSALGFFTAPRAFDVVRSHKVPLASADFGDIEQVFGALEREAEGALKSAGAAGQVRFERSVDARFVGQGSETPLPVPGGDFAQLSRADLRQRFDTAYARLYGRTYAECAVEFVSFRVRASLPVKLLELPRLPAVAGATAARALKGERPAYCPVAGGMVPHTVYDRYRLAPGVRFTGPAIVEERESTVVIGAGGEARVDEYGFLWIDLG
ncbi:MAG: hypothetical protein U1F06_00795 [Steroidobacteraceae bacterium]